MFWSRAGEDLANPTLARSRWISSSRSSAGRLFKAAWPPVRRCSPHCASVAAVTPSSRAKVIVALDPPQLGETDKIGHRGRLRHRSRANTSWARLPPAAARSAATLPAGAPRAAHRDGPPHAQAHEAGPHGAARALTPATSIFRGVREREGALGEALGPRVSEETCEAGCIFSWPPAPRNAEGVRVPTPPRSTRQPRTGGALRQRRSRGLDSECGLM